MCLKHLFNDTSSQMAWNYLNSLFYRKFVAKIAIYHAIISRNRKKSTNMLIISLNMHEIMNNQIGIDFASNPLSDLTGKSSMVKNIEFSYHEIITRLLKKADFRRK